MKKGEATGPQRRPKKPAAVPPEPQAEPEVFRGDDRQRLREAWDRTGQRLTEECDRMALAMAQFPASDDLRAGTELPVETVMSLERKVTELRCQLEQLLSMVG